MDPSTISSFAVFNHVLYWPAEKKILKCHTSIPDDCTQPTDLKTFNSTGKNNFDIIQLIIDHRSLPPNKVLEHKHIAY